MSWRRSRTAKSALLLVTALGLWLFGSGVYIHAKAQLAQVLLHVAWERTLRGAQRVKPWPWADTWPVARMRVPRQRIDMIVLAGDSGRTLAFGPGVNLGGALPAEPGRSLISGHRDTHFRFLQAVRVNDEVEIQDRNGTWLRYAVAAASIIDATRGVLNVDAEDDAVVLLTCYPFDALIPGGPLRYVVTAVPR